MILPTNKRTQPLEALKPKITAQQAVDYFSSHPEVLMEHPTLLAELMLPFSNFPTSLVERHIRKLREQNATYQQECIKIKHQLHTQNQHFENATQLIESLLLTSNSTDLFKRLRKGLSEYFHYEQTHLCFFTDHDFLYQNLLNADLLKTELANNIAEPFIRLLPSQAFAHNDAHFNITFGPLRPHEKQCFFQKSELVQSAAIIPISLQSPQIILSIGNHNPLFFTPTKASSHLKLLQKTLSCLLIQYFKKTESPKE